MYTTIALELWLINTFYDYNIVLAYQEIVIGF